QVVVDAQADFGANLHLRHANEHVERIGDAAIRRVFERYDAIIRVLADHLLENGGDGRGAIVGHRLAEAFEGREVAVTVLRTQKGDALNLLDGARTRNQFAENRLQRHFLEWSLICFEYIGQDFFLAGRGEDLAPLVRFHLADLPGDGGPTIEELQDMEIELVDLDAQRLQVGV